LEVIIGAALVIISMSMVQALISVVLTLAEITSLLVAALRMEFGLATVMLLGHNKFTITR
jgi:hypothetical protein